MAPPPGALIVAFPAVETNEVFTAIGLVVEGRPMIRLGNFDGKVGPAVAIQLPMGITMSTAIKLEPLALRDRFETTKKILSGFTGIYAVWKISALARHPGPQLIIM